MTENIAPNWLKPASDQNELAKQLWPNSAVRAEDGSITIGGVSLNTLASEHGTPLYVVDEQTVRSNAEAIRSSFVAACEKASTSGSVYYATKALLTGAVVKWVLDEGLRVDVATLGELELALAAGAPPERIGLHGNNKSDAELERAIGVGLGSIVIDSANEVDRVARIAEAAGKQQTVRLRVNSGVHASTHEYLATAAEDQKFGVTQSDVPPIVAKIRAAKGLRFLGLHSHIGSQILGNAGFVEAAGRLLELHAKLLEGGEVPELNLGGGFGIPYVRSDEPVDIPGQVSKLVETVAEICVRLGIPVPALAIEPGRAIVGTAGVTLYRVGEIKPVPVSGTETRTYVSVDGGMSDNLRTALYRADYSAVIASRRSSTKPMLSRVVGKHCESGDIVVRDEYLPSDLSPGDLLAVPVTGAYCYSLASNYNGIPRPAVVSVREGDSTIIVRRETIAEVYARDTQLERPLP